MSQRACILSRQELAQDASHRLHCLPELIIHGGAARQPLSPSYEGKNLGDNGVTLSSPPTQVSGLDLRMKPSAICSALTKTKEIETAGPTTSTQHLDSNHTNQSQNYIYIYLYIYVDAKASIRH